MAGSPPHNGKVLAVDTATEAGRRRRRRIPLTPVRTIPVTCTGGRAGEGPLTLGQLNIFRWLSRVADPFYGILHVELPVPDGVSVDDVAEAVAALGARHEALRTTYFDGEQPRQRVAASGVVTLEVCALGDGEWGPRDRPAVAEALVRWLRESPDPARPPVRLVVATAHRADRPVIACAAAFSHLAVDHGSIEIVKREFADMVGDPALRQAGEPRHQPLDQARLEATPTERRRAERALRHLQAQSQRMPHRMYALPDARAGGESLVVELSSVAAAAAVRRVATRTRTSRSAIVIAALCAVLAHRLGTRELVLPLNSSNRFERHLIQYVGALSQNCVATVDIGDNSFDALVAHTWATVLEASRQARYDTAERAESDRRIEYERGLVFHHDLLFNSLVAESPLAMAHRGVALGPTELRWRPVPWNGTPLRFDLNQIDGRLLLEAWSADTGLAPRAELESLLLAVERLLVAAADGDLDAARIPDVIGLAPVVRTADWLLVDSCWVDLTDVQRLLDEAFAVARIFPSAAGQPLVAYLVATDSVHTPEQAHARCVAALPRHPTALTPRHYVVCATAPPDPTDLAAWPPPLAAGTGRTLLGVHG
jgi:hypothetical protein